MPNFSNTAPESALDGAIDDSVTSLDVTAGDGTDFPAAEFNIRIRDSGGTKVPEVLRVTVKATDTFTVTRGYDNTTAQSWSDGDIVEHVVIAEDMDRAWSSSPNHPTPIGGSVSRGTLAISGTTNVAIAFTTEIRDDGGVVDLASNDTRLTVPFSGWYAVTGFIDYPASSKTRYLNVRVNGTDWPAQQSANMSDARISIAYVGYFDADDYVELVTWVSTGETIDSANFSISAMGGSGYADTWLDALFTRPSDETVHTDDQEFNGTIGGTAQDASGTITWTQSRGILSAAYEDTSPGSSPCRLYALTPTTFPVTIETAIRTIGEDGKYPLGGICLTDGTATSANLVGCAYVAATFDASMYSGTIASSSSTTNDIVESPVSLLIYMRLIWTATNTFEATWSIDGVSWSKFATTSTSKTITPTHFGAFIGGMDTATSVAITSFEYLRVTESDLSA